MKLNKRRKKAFTLTELLVVVIIIGVLSAVVLPKFNKIIETRKTTEAEELMSAVRTEQEKRCALDKDYLAESEKLADILPSTDTKNFTYSLTSTGITASSKGKYSYQLQMPSYADGRICCENTTECLKLNKDYPLCSELLAKADYDDGSACASAVATPPAPPPCTLQDYTEECPAGHTGIIRHTVDENCQYVTVNTCAPTATGCTGTKPAYSQTCNSCGTQLRTVTCNTETSQWEYTEWGECSVSHSAYCSCSQPLDLGLGAFPAAGFCCIGNEIYDTKGNKTNIEQQSGGLCCTGNVNCDRATYYDDGSRMGCTCSPSGSGSSSSGSGSSSGECNSGTASTTVQYVPCGLTAANSCSSFKTDLSRSGCSCDVVSAIERNKTGDVCDYDLQVKFY